MNLKSFRISSLLLLSSLLTQTNINAQNVNYLPALNSYNLFPNPSSNNIPNSIYDAGCSKIHTYSDNIYIAELGESLLVNGHAWSRGYSPSSIQLLNSTAGFSLNTTYNNVEITGYYEFESNVNSVEIGTIYYQNKECFIAAFEHDDKVKFRIFTVDISNNQMIINPVETRILGSVSIYNKNVRMDTHDKTYGAIIYDRGNEIEICNFKSNGSTIDYSTHTFDYTNYPVYTSTFDVALTNSQGKVYSLVSVLGYYKIDILETLADEMIYNSSNTYYDLLFSTTVSKSDYISLDCPDFSDYKQFAYAFNNPDNQDVSVQTYNNGVDKLFSVSEGINFDSNNRVLAGSLAYDPYGKLISVGMVKNTYLSSTYIPENSKYISTVRYEDGTVPSYLNNTFEYMYIDNDLIEIESETAVSFNQNNAFNNNMYLAYFGNKEFINGYYCIRYKNKDINVNYFKKQIPLANSWSVYPNPFNQSFILNGGVENEKYHYSLNNILGQNILNYQGDNQGFNNQVNNITNSLPAGTYLLNVQNNDEQQSLKLIKQ